MDTLNPDTALPEPDPKPPAEVTAEIQSTNWFATFLSPFGTSSRVVFTRAQMMIWLIRTVVIIVGVVGLITGAMPFPVVGLLVAVTFLLTSLVSTVTHVRRMADAGRPTALAVFAALPTIALAGMLAFHLYQVGDLMGRFQKMMAAMQPPPAAVQQAEPTATEPEPAGAAASEEAQDPEDQAEPETETASADTSQAAQSEAATSDTPQRQARANQRSRARTGGRPGARGGRGRGGPGGQQFDPFNTQKRAMQIIMFWALGTLIALIFTWAYAARVKSKQDREADGLA